MDYDVLLDSLAVPNRMYTTDASLLIETEADLRDVVKDFRAFLSQSGAQDYHRIARRADFDPHTDDRIQGEHDTYVLRGGLFALEPFASSQIIERMNETWRGVECRSHVRNTDCTVFSLAQLQKSQSRNPSRELEGT
ncbi:MULTISPECIES: hypothetical protein [unclassified Marinovum]